MKDTKTPTLYEAPIAHFERTEIQNAALTFAHALAGIIHNNFITTKLHPVDASGKYEDLRFEIYSSCISIATEKIISIEKEMKKKPFRTYNY